MEARLEQLDVTACEVPLEQPESDGTLQWDSHTMVVVEATCGGQTGLGYTYSHLGAAHLIATKLRPVVKEIDVFDTSQSWNAMRAAVRNLGRFGLAMAAISAVDCALWDLKARLLNAPLAQLLGRVRESAPVYGSGGFTSYSVEQLREQLRGWVEAGVSRVKMKIGRDTSKDVTRVRSVREAIGPGAELFVDANGAYDRKQALEKAEAFADMGVTWFEEPVSSDDVEGLRLVRDRAPAGMEITAGEYGFDLFYFRRMLEANAVDVLQPDITRCGGISGFQRISALCEAQPLPISAHTAPSEHLAPCLASTPLRHIEYFHDHVRIEHLLLEGAAELREGRLWPDLSQAGSGLAFRRADAEQYIVWQSKDE